MISLTLLLVLLGIATLPFGHASFAVASATLLLVPIELTLFGSFVPVGFPLCAGLLILNLTLCFLLRREQIKVPLDLRSLLSHWREHQALFLWIGSSLFVFQLCMLWPDFIAMGERLRDFALLAEVIKHPVYPTEPWLPGENLNYYLFWYRLGAVLHQLTGLEIYELYHGLQAVTFSLYITAIFSILHRIGGLRSYLSYGYSFIIACGSNVAGLLYALNQTGQSWWGPSRVVKGAINEFPIWSLLLGDLHPHYLNLPLLLLFILWGYNLFITRTQSPNLLLLILLLIASPLWVYNANAWEVPVLLLYLGFTALLYLFAASGTLFGQLRTIIEDIRTTRFTEITLSSIVIIIGCIAALFTASRHISPGGDPFRLVRETIPLTTTKELFLHFGFQLAVITAALLWLQKSWQQYVIVLFAVGASLLSSVALPLIVLLLILQAQHLISKNTAEQASLTHTIFGAIGLTSLSLLLLPELFFLDDPYGGENERMNTIFKAYSANWAFLSIYAVMLARDVCSKSITDSDLKKVLAPIMLIFCAVLTLPFFIHTIQERRIPMTTIEPRIQGLSSLERQYGGAGAVIQGLYNAPEGRTAEAPGNPYSLTSHVCTLAGKQCYIGWKNHVDLLTRNYKESTRREAVLNQLYASTDCQKAQTLMKQEQISYLVIGPLEQQRYGAVDPNVFNCLKTIASSGNYTVLSDQ